jgi:hypothetical protein
VCPENIQQKEVKIQQQDDPSFALNFDFDEI